MRKIMYISASSDFGGGPQHMYDLVSNTRKFSEITVVTPKKGIFWKKFELLSLDLISIPHRKFNILTAIKLCIIAKNKSIDLIHSHGKGGDVYARFVAFYSGIPLVYTPHGIHYEQYNFLFKFIYFIYEKITSFIVTKFILVSNSEKKEALRLGLWDKKKFRVINNGIVKPKISVTKSVAFKKLIEYKKNNKFKHLIVNLSRFNYQKNPEEIIKISERVPNSLFCIIGDGEHFSKIKKILQEKKFKNIYLPGFIEKTNDIVNICDIYLSTSRWEGMPLSIIEAMSLKKPIIATNVIGNIDLIKNNKNGFLYKLGHIDMAASLIERMVSKKNLMKSMGIESGRLQKKSFSIDQMVSKIDVIYKELDRLAKKINKK